MLQQRQGSLLLVMNSGFMTPRERNGELSFGPRILRAGCADAPGKRASSQDGAGAPNYAYASPDEDDSLEEAVRDEREYVRRRLREELKREPTEQELDEWLRQHTEGY